MSPYMYPALRCWRQCSEIDKHVFSFFEIDAENLVNVYCLNAYIKVYVNILWGEGASQKDVSCKGVGSIPAEAAA